MKWKVWIVIGDRLEMELKWKVWIKYNYKYNIKILREIVKLVMMFVNRMINYFLLNGLWFRIGFFEEDKCLIFVYECLVIEKNIFWMINSFYFLGCKCCWNEFGGMLSFVY